MATYEAWEDPDQNAASCGTAEQMADYRRRSLLGAGPVLLYSFEAATHEEAQAIHSFRMGWGPYRPEGEPKPCPQCGAFFYPRGSGECWRCRTTKAPAPRDPIAVYNTALSLLNEQARIIWQTFAAFLVAHGLILGSLIREFGSSANAAAPTPGGPVFVAASAGLALCIPWAAALSRSLGLYHFRSAQLRAAEPPNWDLFAGKGNAFAEGETVIVDEKDLRGTLRLSWLARFLRTRTTMWLLIAIVAIVYMIVVFKVSPWSAGASTQPAPCSSGVPSAPGGPA